MSIPPDDLRTLAVRLEIPDCACPQCRAKPIPCGCDGPCSCPVRLPPPCDRITSHTHTLTLAEWSELLAYVDPESHLDPPPPHAPALVMTRQARVEVMARRQRERRGLYHPGDLYREPVPDVHTVPVRRANGRWVEEELEARETAEDPDDEIDLDAELAALEDWRPWWARPLEEARVAA